MTRSVLVDSGAGGLAVVSVDPLEAAQFAPIATTRATTHDDAEVTQALAKLCLPGGQYDDRPRVDPEDKTDDRPDRPVAANVPSIEAPRESAARLPSVRPVVRPPKARAKP